MMISIDKEHPSIHYKLHKPSRLIQKLSRMDGGEEREDMETLDLLKAGNISSTKFTKRDFVKDMCEFPSWNIRFKESVSSKEF